MTVTDRQTDIHTPGSTLTGFGGTVRRNKST